MNPSSRRFRKGVLTFEWVLLLTVLVIGIVGGLSAVRDAVISEMGDVVGAAVAVDQSYTVQTSECGSGNAFQFTDSLPSCAGSGQRPATPPADQGTIEAPPCAD